MLCHEHGLLPGQVFWGPVDGLYNAIDNSVFGSMGQIQMQIASIHSSNWIEDFSLSLSELL